MNSQLFIPKKCKVGFNIRDDTFSGKLGYVIAFDGKKWRKENSWSSWIQEPGDKVFVGYEKDEDGTTNYQKRIEKELGEDLKPIEFDNVPTSGFVLNKKVGGYKSGWDTRQTYARVYDPRGFEFEIDIPNLLYILEHSNCMRGKGLEGDFIYSWDGKDLVLLPSESPEFKAATSFTNLQSLKISTKELVPGLIYKSKREEEFVYLGRYPWYDSTYGGRKKGKPRNAEKKHIFYQYSKYERYGQPDFVIKNSVEFLAQKASDEPAANFSSLIEKLKNDIRANDIISFEFKKKEYSEASKSQYGFTVKDSIFFLKNKTIISQYAISARAEYSKIVKENILKGYIISKESYFNLDTKTFSYIEREYQYGGGYPGRGYYKSNEEHINIGELKGVESYNLYAILENGNKVKIESLNQL